MSTLIKNVPTEQKPRFKQSDVQGFNNRTENWTVERFLKVPPFYKNRDVLPRVKKKKGELEKKYLPSHINVKVGRCIKAFKNYKVGDLFVIDGNTRAEVWRQYPHLEPPIKLSVEIIDFDNKDDVEDTYYSYDNVSAVEKSNEIITGHFRDFGHTFSSKVIKSGKIKTAIIDSTKWIESINGIPNKEAKLEDKLRYYWNEIIYLDNINMDGIKKNSSNLFACLLMIGKKYGTSNRKFNKLLENLKLEFSEHNTENECDGVHHVLVNLFGANFNLWKVTGFKKSPDLICEMLFSLDQYIKGKLIPKRKDYTSKRNDTYREFFMNYIN